MKNIMNVEKSKKKGSANQLDLRKLMVSVKRGATQMNLCVSPEKIETSVSNHALHPMTVKRTKEKAVAIKMVKKSAMFSQTEKSEAGVMRMKSIFHVMVKRAFA